METAIIIVLLFMLLIAVIILIDIDIDRKGYIIIIQDCKGSLYKLKKENEKLKSKNADFKITIDEQEERFNKHLKKTFDYGELKTNELLTKYKSSLIKINERDEKIRLRDNEILKYDKCNKQIAEELIKKDNIIEDSYIRIKNMEQEKQLAINQRNNANEEKQFAIHQSKRCIKLCNEMSIRFKLINSELEAIELQLKRKVKS